MLGRWIVLLGMGGLGCVWGQAEEPGLGGAFVFEQREVEGWIGMHSYAWGRMGQRFVFVGGRCDGLHARQPFRSFPGENQLPGFTVWDSEKEQAQWVPWLGIPDSLLAQLQSSNAAFLQVGEDLLFAGGYSYAAHRDDHMTHPRLLVLHLPSLLEAADQGGVMAEAIEVHSDDRWAVTGGRMGWVGQGADQVLVCAGGHRFDGRYNPIGRPTYVQQYVDGIQPFRWNRVEGVTWLPPWRDEVHLHRRDFNWVQQVLPGGGMGGLLAGGVFQHEVDLPFVHPVDVHPSGAAVSLGSSQRLNQYHTAGLSLFSARDSMQHVLFFGGMATHRWVASEWTVDGDVPFVDQIGWLKRSSAAAIEAEANWTEWQRPERLPFLGGAASEFLLHPDVPLHRPGIVDWDAVLSSKGDSVLLGYIVGGIVAEWENPFAYNLTEDTEAGSGIWTVWWQRGEERPSRLREETDGAGWEWVWLAKGPRKRTLELEVVVADSSHFRYHLVNGLGERVQWGGWDTLAPGTHWLEISLLMRQREDWRLDLTEGDGIIRSQWVPWRRRRR